MLPRDKLPIDLKPYLLFCKILKIKKSWFKWSFSSFCLMSVHDKHGQKSVSTLIEKEPYLGSDPFPKGL